MNASYTRGCPTRAPHVWSLERRSAIGSRCPSLGSDSPLPQHRRSRGISRGDRRSKRGPHTWVLYVTLTWEASNGTGQLYTRRSIAAVFSRKYPMAQRSRGTPSDDRRSRRTQSMPPQSHPPMKYRGDQKKVFSLCSQHTGGGRCGHGDPEGSKAF